MTLKEHIDDIRNKLNQDAYRNESDVFLSIVYRLFEPLGWPIYDTQVVLSKYNVNNRGLMVDFALCHPRKKPIVFIKVEQTEKNNTQAETLLQYALRQRVPITLFTDGRKWRFFNSTEEEAYKHKICELDIIESDSEEASNLLIGYLNYKAIQTGEAITAIKNDYQKVSKQREIEARLPEAWSKLLQDKDESSEFLIEAVASKTEKLCDFRPTQEQVLTFLKRLSVPPTGPKDTKKSPKRLRVTMPEGKVIERTNGNRTFVDTIEQLGIEHVKELGIRKNTISLISTSKDPKRAQIQMGEYFIVSHISAQGMKNTLDEIAEKLEIPLEVELVNKV